jgi:hypothetical protein
VSDALPSSSISLNYFISRTRRPSSQAPRTPPLIAPQPRPFMSQYPGFLTAGPSMFSEQSGSRSFLPGELPPPPPLPFTHRSPTPRPLSVHYHRPSAPEPRLPSQTSHPASTGLPLYSPSPTRPPVQPCLPMYDRGQDQWCFDPREWSP